MNGTQNPETMMQAEIQAELDRLVHHTGYTADPTGTKARRRDQQRIAALKAALDGEYEHDPDDCAECQREAELLEELHDE